MPPLEREGLKILTPNKLLIRLPQLLTQTKAGNNSNNLKKNLKKSGKFGIFFISLIKSPK